MGQVNISYLVLMLIIFATGLEAGKLIEIRLRRDYYLKKYKPGTIQHQTIQRSLNPPLLVSVTVALVLAIILLIADVRVHANYADFLLIMLFVLAVIALGFATIPTFVLPLARKSRSK